MQASRKVCNGYLGIRHHDAPGSDDQSDSALWIWLCASTHSYASEPMVMRFCVHSSWSCSNIRRCASTWECVKASLL